MKSKLAALAVYGLMAGSALANLGTTYQWSAVHWQDQGIKGLDPSTVSFHWRGLMITEGYNYNGTCDVIQFAHLDATPLSSQEIGLILSLQANGWQHYANNAAGYPCWAGWYQGVRYYALYYPNKTVYANGAVRYVMCLRVGTEAALVDRGIFSAPNRPKQVTHRSRPKPKANPGPRLANGTTVPI